MKKILSSVLAVLLIVTAFACLAACKDGNGTIADNTQFYSEITDTLKLKKDYQCKSFLTQGIGEATLISHTDGDTTRFLLSEGEEVVIRYYSVDTRESTGDVEKWGKAASHFVKTKLSKETQIVLEATEIPAKTDSYGSRYLGYVWYKNANDADFKLLNLELVENGFSENTGVHNSDYPYWSYFDKAQTFAKSIKLRIFSDLDDPLFNNNPVQMTVKDFAENPYEFYNEETDVGSKVTFQAALTSVYISGTGTHTYKGVQYDPETGKTYTIDIYCAYASNNASKMPLGHLYQVVGTVQYYKPTETSNGRFQISGVYYDIIYGPDNPDYSNPIQKNYYLFFDSQVTYDNRHNTCLYTDLTVTEVSTLGSDMLITANAKLRNSEGPTGSDVQFKITVKGSANKVSSVAVGSQISTQGFQFVKDSHNITVINFDDLIIR